MTDFRGAVIDVGDIIAYPGRSGSHVWMNEARTVDVFKGNGKRRDEDGYSAPFLVVTRIERDQAGACDGRTVALSNLSNIVLVQRAQRP